MFIELVDHLRCPRPHADSWLVLAAHRTVERHVLTGTLGCPVCEAEFTINDGVVCFASRRPLVDAFADEEEATRIAAFLDLTIPAGFALLQGAWASQAPMVATLAPTPLVLLNASARVDAQPGISPIVAEHCPMAANSLHAAACDGTMIDDIVRAVRPGGRVLAPASLPVPNGVEVIARDARAWLGEKNGGGPLLSIRRR